MFISENARSQDTPTTMNEPVRNSVFAGTNLLTISLTYDRAMGMKESSKLLLGAGVRQVVAFGEGTIPYAKIAWRKGKNKHFFEGGTYLAVMEDFIPVVPMIAYRRQGESGFLFRIELGLYAEEDTYLEPGDKTYDFFPMPEISLGYSF